MITLIQLALALVQNVVPAGGVVFRGWSPATALTLYWFENVVASVLVAIKIAMHRRLTHKRGHYRVQLDSEVTPGQKPSFLKEFVTITLGFTLIHGVFLGALLIIVVKEEPSRVQVVQGLKWMIPTQIARFLLSLINLRNMSFFELKKGASQVLGRIGLIQFSIMGGMLISAVSSRPKALFTVFGVLKTISDIACSIPYDSRQPAEVPRWFLVFVGLFGIKKHWKTGQDVATWWRESAAADRCREEEDEEVITPAKQRT